MGSKSKVTAPKGKATVADRPNPGLEPVTPTTVADKLDDGQSVAALPFADEVSARSADNLKPSEDFTKVFVLGPGTYTAEAGFDHEPNKAAARQYAIDSGLWPVADVEHVSTKTHADGVSQVLTYRVAVAPAHRVAASSPNPEVIDPETGDVADAQNADASKA